MYVRIYNYRLDDMGNIRVMPACIIMAQEKIQAVDGNQVCTNI